MHSELYHVYVKMLEKSWKNVFIFNVLSG